MSSRGLCRPEISGTARAKRKAQESVSHGTSASHRLSGKAWAAVATIVTVFITMGQLAVTVRDGEHKERERCFDPKFLDQLVSCNPQRRALATAILKTCGFPKEDVENILRQTRALDQVCSAGNAPAPVPTPTSPPYGPVRTELRSKRLLGTLEDAADFAAANSPTETEQALTRYLRVLDRLSPAAKAAFDPELMRKYDAAMKKQDAQQAVQLLSSAFRPYLDSH